MKNPQVKNLIKSLFENGIESYDREKRQPTNLGGAGLWYVNGWKNPNNGRIVFNSPEFYDSLRQCRALLFTMSRVQVDQNGDLAKVEGTGQYQRTNHCLALYFQEDFTRRAADSGVERILHDFPELEGYVYNLHDFKEELEELGMVDYDENGVAILRDATYFSSREQSLSGIKLHAMVLLAVSSGSQESAQLWSFASKAGTASREEAASRFVAQREQLEEHDLPF